MTIPDWRDSDAWLAGGTWLFSEQQPGVRRLIDLEGLRWESLQVQRARSHNCSDVQDQPALLLSLRHRSGRAAPLIRQCCRSLLASFKIWNTATVGGNICMSLPAGAMISLTAALEGVCTIWQRDGSERPCRSWISSPAFTRTSSDRAICFAASTCRHLPFRSERAFAECR